ncbi:MAG: hypothetical protein KAJ03_12040 [Gammaproteobacteria bacterium]|nr:hypothetical protein [Gammaproteobacteria bacterium]
MVARKDRSGHWIEKIKILRGNILKSIIGQENAFALKHRIKELFVINQSVTMRRRRLVHVQLQAIELPEETVLIDDN